MAGASVTSAVMAEGVGAGAPDGVRGALDAVPVAVDQGHAGPRFGQGERGGRPDAAGRARDERDTALEVRTPGGIR